VGVRVLVLVPFGGRIRAFAGVRVLVLVPFGGRLRAFAKETRLNLFSRLLIISLLTILLLLVSLIDPLTVS
jgi:hypothetical protein